MLNRNIMTDNKCIKPFMGGHSRDVTVDFRKDGQCLVSLSFINLHHFSQNG